jgi:hypothetical protein
MPEAKTFLQSQLQQMAKLVVEEISVLQSVGGYQPSQPDLGDRILSRSLKHP